MSIAGRFRARRLRPHLVEQSDFYGRARLPNDIRQWQLDRFNELWPRLCRTVPYFQRLCEHNKLSTRFPTWQAFQDVMPITDRRVAQAGKAFMSDRTKPPDFWRTTGGSTAEPLQIPVWKSESSVAAENMWYARKWFGISPSDRLFLLWGHSHLLGTGWVGQFNGAKRRLQDALLNYCRYSAYDLGRQSLRDAADTLMKFRPAYMLGYAVALDRFARINHDLRRAFHKLNLKVVIATAESFPKPDSAGFIADTFGCPVAMEYGSVETGPIAHQRPDMRYSVFWRRYFLEGCESLQMPGAYEIFVTSLYPRCFPLVRYRLGDLISTNPNHKNFRQEFDAVIGRCNDYVTLPSGSVVHSEAFSHVVKDIPEVLAYQVIQSSNEDITLKYVASGTVESHAVAQIKQRLNKINPALASIRLERVDSLEQTIAGKTRRVIRVS